MQYHLLGKTNYQVSKICFGALTIGPIHANLSAAAGGEVLLQALKMGINFIDTAQYYGTYSHLHYALQHWQGQPPIIASKSYAVSYQSMQETVDEARKEMNVDKIDIFLLHEIKSQQDLLDRKDALKYLFAAKQQGLIGAVGISTHSAQVAQLIADGFIADLDVIHPMINLTGQGILDGSRDQMIEALEQCHSLGMGVYGMKAIGGGALYNKAQEALNWAFQLPCLDAVAVGMKTKAEVITNVNWLNGIDPPESKLVKQQKRTLSIENHCYGCGKCISRCPQKALSLENGQAVWHEDQCILCGYCIPVCEESCLTLF